MRKFLLLGGAALAAAVFVDLSAAPRSSGVAEAQAACRAKPDTAPPAGRHWYYNTDPKTKRRCWYVGRLGTKVVRRNAQTLQQAGPVRTGPKRRSRPAVPDAEAESRTAEANAAPETTAQRLAAAGNNALRADDFPMTGSRGGTPQDDAPEAADPQPDTASVWPPPLATASEQAVPGTGPVRLALVDTRASRASARVPGPTSVSTPGTSATDPPAPLIGFGLAMALLFGSLALAGLLLRAATRNKLRLSA